MSRMSTGQSGLDGDDWERLENTIRSASLYVVPSEQHRPQSIEAAHVFAHGRKSNFRFALFALALLLWSSILCSVEQRLDKWFTQFEGPTASELNEHAIRIAHKNDTTFHWGLVESFQVLRFDRSARLELNSDEIRPQ